MSNWTKKIVKSNSFLVVTSIVVVLIILEIILRTFFIKVYEPSILPNYFRADEELGYDLSENYEKSEYVVEGKSFLTWTNEFGCWDDPYEGESQPILLVGDSFTWGAVPFEYNFGSIIEKTTSKRVLKCGVGGFETKGEFIKAERIINKAGINPELIIVGHLPINDIYDRWRFPTGTVVDGYLVNQNSLNYITGEKVIYSEEEAKNSSAKLSESFIYRTKEWLRNNVALYKSISLARRKINKLFTTDKYLNTFGVHLLVFDEVKLWEEEAWKLNLRDIEEFSDYASSINAEIIFVVIPIKEQVYQFLGSDYPDLDFELPNEILQRFFKENNIKYLDLLPEFKEYANQISRRDLDLEDDLYYRYDGHWNNNGSYLAGLLISKHILEAGLVNVSGREEVLNEIKRELLSIKNNRND